MRFTKQNARFYGAKGGCCATHKKSESTLQKERNEAIRVRNIENEEYARFLTATDGIFNGFAMVNVFHENINKENAIIIDESDDCATCRGVHVGSDGVTVYFFCDPKNAKKQVQFNRSVYVF